MSGLWSDSTCCSAQVKNHKFHKSWNRHVQLNGVWHQMVKKSFELRELETFWSYFQNKVSTASSFFQVWKPDEEFPSLPRWETLCWREKVRVYPWPGDGWPHHALHRDKGACENIFPDCFRKNTTKYVFSDFFDIFFWKLWKILSGKVRFLHGSCAVALI